MKNIWKERAITVPMFIGFSIFCGMIGVLAGGLYCLFDTATYVYFSFWAIASKIFWVVSLKKGRKTDD